MITAPLVTASYTRSTTGLQFHDDITFEEWERLGVSLSKEYSGLQWAIGDWINYGEYRFGEKYAQALDSTNYNYGTLRNYASICARIPPPVRPPELLFHQIKYVAQLNDYEQQRKVIDFAVAHKLTGDEILAIVQKTIGRPARAEAVTGRVVSVNEHDAMRVVVFDEPNNWQPGQRVTIKAVTK